MGNFLLSYKTLRLEAQHESTRKRLRSGHHDVDDDERRKRIVLACPAVILAKSSLRLYNLGVTFGYWLCVMLSK